MNLGGLEVLDVAIGLVVLFFLLSTAIASINETIANILGWRAKTLEDALRNLVGDKQAKEDLKSWLGRVDPPDTTTPVEIKPGGPVITTLWGHWRMKALVRDPDSTKRRRARPSYLPPRAFSLALAETLAAGAQGGETAEKSLLDRTDDQIFEGVKKAADALPDGQLKDIISKASVNAEGKLDNFRAQVEHLFDDSMERASGWYKRKVQVALAILATIVVVGFNVDTVQVATSLWNDGALRDAVSATAAQAGSPEDAAKAIDTVEELGLPIGWSDNAPDNVFAAIPGWLIAIAALNLGAPFWFDLLSRLARLRGSGLQASPRALSDTAGVTRERQEIAGTTAGEATPTALTAGTAAPAALTAGEPPPGEPA